MGDVVDADGLGLLGAFARGGGVVGRGLGVLDGVVDGGEGLQIGGARWVSVFGSIRDDDGVRLSAVRDW